jgi:hypothetical protein
VPHLSPLDQCLKIIDHVLMECVTHRNSSVSILSDYRLDDRVPGPYYSLGTIGTVPRAYDIFRAYEGMEGRKQNIRQ